MKLTYEAFRREGTATGSGRYKIELRAAESTREMIDDLEDWFEDNGVGCQIRRTEAGAEIVLERGGRELNDRVKALYKEWKLIKKCAKERGIC